MSIKINTVFLRNKVPLTEAPALWAEDLQNVAQHLQSLSNVWDNVFDIVNSTVTIMLNRHVLDFSIKNGDGNLYFGEQDRFYSGYNSNSNAVSWGVILTPQGAALAPPLFTLAEDMTENIDVHHFNIFFATLSNVIDDTDTIPAIFYTHGGYQNINDTLNTLTKVQEHLINDITWDGNFTSNYGCSIISTEHGEAEQIPVDFIMQQHCPVGIGSAETKTFWFTNMLCKNIPYYANHVYIKLYNSTDNWDIIHVENSWFFAGNHFILEIGKKGEK